jgi:hypothetical protein
MTELYSNKSFMNIYNNAVLEQYHSSNADGNDNNNVDNNDSNVEYIYDCIGKLSPSHVNEVVKAIINNVMGWNLRSSRAISILDR